MAGIVPTSLVIMAGLLTWLIWTGRYDLGPAA